jgi:hypothetical protein
MMLIAMVVGWGVTSEFRMANLSRLIVIFITIYELTLIFNPTIFASSVSLCDKKYLINKKIYINVQP